MGVSANRVINMVEAPLPPADIRILGAGRFGRIAVERLSDRFPHARLLVVDADEARLGALRERRGIEIRIGDGVLSLENDPVPDEGWVVPAVPVHVAFQWLLRRLAPPLESRAIAIPDAIDGLVPNPCRGAGGALYASFATFICPDTCSEPDTICTHTKGPRPGNLFETLSQVAIPGFSAVVLRSLQLAPGVGGYTGGQLKTLLETVSRKEGNYLIATSCRCHGVMNGLNWKRA